MTSPPNPGLATTPAPTPPSQAAPTPARLTAIVWALAGLLLAGFPLVRPWQDKSGDLVGAFTDPRWVIAHSLGAAGFVALAVALRLRGSTDLRVTDPRVKGSRVTGSRSPSTEAWAWAAVALLLPYYGAEGVGLHGVAVASADAGVVERAAESIRYTALPVATFALGLLALAIAGGRIAWSAWSGTGAARASAVVAGFGLATYLPQFFLPPSGRIAHGVILGAALVVLAVTSWRTSARR